MEGTVTERRRWLRFEAALNAFCEMISEKWKASSKIKNISKDGALLIVDKPLEEGAELNLTMEVPGDNVPIFASCQVAWQSGSAPAGAYETGVRFTKMDGADRGRLLEYIYSQWLRLLEKEP